MFVVRRAIVYAADGGASLEKAQAIRSRTGIEVVNITDFSVNDIDTYGFLIFVVPGSSEPSDSSSEIWGRLLSRTKHLNGLKFAVWALSDSNIGETFLGFARTLEAKLEALGATEVTTLGITDVSGTNSTDFGAWLKTLGVLLA